MSTAVFHTLSLEGEHGDVNYVYTIWNEKDLMNGSTVEGGVVVVNPLLEQVIKKGNEPSALIFPCSEKMHANITKIGGRMSFCASKSYQITPDQERVHLVFEKTLEGRFTLSIKSDDANISSDNPIR